MHFTKTKKSVISVLLSVLFAVLPYTMAHAYMLGDWNRDGFVTSADARMALRTAVGLETFAPDSETFLALDVNSDGDITSADARMILRVAVGLDQFAINDHEHVPADNESPIPCGNGGVLHEFTCVVCGQTILQACVFGEEKHPLYESKPGPATCTESFEWYKLCTVCGGKQIGSDPALRHSNRVKVPEKKVEATCTEDGYECYACLLCGKDGSTVPELRKTIPALGHQLPESSGHIRLNEDILCKRCGEVCMPSFNNLVNSVKTDDRIKAFSGLSRITENCEAKSGTISISDVSKWLNGNVYTDGGEINDQSILDVLQALFITSEPQYIDYTENNPDFYRCFPLRDSDNVSRLLPDDISHIGMLPSNSPVEDLPDTVKLAARDYEEQNLARFKATLADEEGYISVSVNVKDERYTDLKNTSAETALMRGTGEDIRTYPAQFTVDEDGFKTTCNDVVSSCVVTYCFSSVTEDGKTVYVPVAAVYKLYLTVDLHMDFTLEIPVSELGLSVDEQRSLLARFGLKENDSVTLAQGSADLTVYQTYTDYYVFG